MTDGWTEQYRAAKAKALESLIGQYVLFYRATLHGRGRMRGTVIRLLPNGKVEIRGSLGGYYEVGDDELAY